MHSEGKCTLRSHNTSYCLIEVVTIHVAGLTVLRASKSVGKHKIGRILSCHLTIQ